MKTWPDGSSPWGKRVAFDDNEFETMMDDLRFRSGDCFAPGKGVDVDRVLMQGVGVEADYIDLPAGVMGRTRFKADGSVMIEVSRNLVDAAETNAISRRRLRTTLAHECGHFACHSMLFIRDSETLSLFEGSRTGKAVDPILCRSEGIEGSGSSGYRGEWWEYQANQCMAALLMPKRLFAGSAKSVLTGAGFESFASAIAAGRGGGLVEALADEYDVSLTATLYRLQALKFVPNGDQKMLKLS